MGKRGGHVGQCGALSYFMGGHVHVAFPVLILSWCVSVMDMQCAGNNRVWGSQLQLG